MKKKKTIYIFLDIDGVLNSITSAVANNRKYEKMSKIRLFFVFKFVRWLEKFKILDPLSHRCRMSYDISYYLLDNLTYLCDVLTNSKFLR